MTSTHATERPDNEASDHGKDSITAIVYATRTDKPKTFHWPKTTLVGEAARLAAIEFGYKQGTPGLQELKEPKTVLDNNKTLDGAGVRNGDKLEIIDTGGGV